MRIDSTFRKMCKQNCSSMILESENSFHSMKSIKNRPYITTETTRRVVHVHEEYRSIEQYRQSVVAVNGLFRRIRSIDTLIIGPLVFLNMLFPRVNRYRWLCCGISGYTSPLPSVRTFRVVLAWMAVVSIRQYHYYSCQLEIRVPLFLCYLPNNWWWYSKMKWWLPSSWISVDALNGPLTQAIIDWWWLMNDANCVSVLESE